MSLFPDSLIRNMCITVYGSQQGTVQQHVVHRSSAGIAIRTVIRWVITHLTLYQNI